jgi:phenylalanyl-tRNA synthetase beta chain
MRVPYEWLKDFVDISVAPEEIAQRLTMIGLEVEAVEFIHGDVVFEVNVTPNRPDCLSILGISREISAAFDIPLRIPLHDVKESLPFSSFSVEIVTPELCNRYAGRVITDVMIADSPEWMKIRLEKCGIRSINNIVDITNYVLLEFGHPLHAFDAETLKNKKIIINTAGAHKKIVTLDGINRELPEDALLIWDNKRPIAVAGVMGGLETEVSENTKNIFLESAFFSPSSVRRTSKKLNLVSESSYRFERGTDIEFLEGALNRAALIIREVAGGIIHEIIDAYPIKYIPKPVEVRYKKINKILGVELSNSRILDILKKLGIRTEDKGEYFIVYPPAFRCDIQRENDISEEIARFYGYDKIPITIPRSPLSLGYLNNKTLPLEMIKQAIRKSGFTEVINYSFMNPTSLDLFDIADSDRRRKTTKIRNPLRQEESFLRTTLIPALIENFKYNLDRGTRDIRLFEISKVFEDKGNSLPLEELHLGGILYEERVPSLWKEEAKGFFIAKGTLESILEDLMIHEYSFSISSEPFFHKGQSADINVGGLRLGYVGVLGPEIVERLDLKKHEPEIVLFELNLEELLLHIPDSIKYKPIPKYPSVERDIAVIVDEDITVSEIENVIKTFSSELIEKVSVFDVYKGKNIPEGKKSLAFNIIYRSMNKTLREEEIERIHTSLVNYILEKTGGELRSKA